MEEPKVEEVDHGEDESNGFLQNDNESPDFESTNNEKSKRLLKALKFSLLKLALNGADMALKDSKSLKTKSIGNGLASNTQEQEWEFEEAPSNSLIDMRNYQNRVNGLKLVKYPAFGLSHFALDILAFSIEALSKFVGFNFSLLVRFLTFPIWFSYFSFMFLLFPLQTLRKLKTCLTKNLCRIWGVAYMNLVSAVFTYLKAQQSLGMKVGMALFRSVSIFSMLLGLLALNLVMGTLLVQHSVEKPFLRKQILNFDYTKASPVAFVPIMAYPTAVEPYAVSFKDGVQAEKRAGNRVIPYNHKLKLTVSLTLPESEYNRKLGVFQVSAELLSANGNAKASSSYPCMLRFKSQPIHYIGTLLKTITLLTGFQSESQILNVKMSGFVEGFEPTACVKVILEQRAGFKMGDGIPEIFAASIELESELPKLKRAIWEWRRTIYVWVSLMLFFVELVFMLVLYKVILNPRVRASIVRNRKVSNLKIITWYKKSS